MRSTAPVAEPLPIAHLPVPARSVTTHHIVMVSWWGGRGGQGLGHIDPVPPRPRRNRCACNFVAAHFASDRRLEVSDVRYRGTYREFRRLAGPWSVKPVPAEARRHSGPHDETPTFEGLIALPPAGSAFFSLVFFAEAKKSDRRPPQGDVVFLWVQKPTPLKKHQPQQHTTPPTPQANVMASRRSTRSKCGKPLKLSNRSIPRPEIISQKAVFRNCRFNPIAVCAGAPGKSAVACPIAPPGPTTNTASSREAPSVACNKLLLSGCRVVVVVGGGFAVFFAALVFAPKGIRHPPAGDAGHSSLLRQRRLTRRKPTLPGAEQSRALGVLVSSYGHSSAGLCRYRFEGPRRCQFPGCVVRPPVAEPLPIRQSAGTGAKRHDTSHRDGFVVGRARWSRPRAYQPGATAPTTELVRLQLRGRPLRERQTA